MIEVNIKLLQSNQPRVRHSQDDGNTQILPPIRANMREGSRLIDLKKEIHRQWQLHPKQQRLTYYTDVLTDDQKTLTEYHIDSTFPVFVEVISATIQLCIVELDGGRRQVNENLNMTLSVLIDPSLKGRCHLHFGKQVLEWESQIRTVQDLEDGSELHCSFSLITLIIASEGYEVDFPNVDQNWTVEEFLRRCFDGSLNPSATAKIKRPISAGLVFEDNQLQLEAQLKAIKKLQDRSKLIWRLPLPGGRFRS